MDGKAMITNDESRRREIERIHTDAVGAVLMRVCQILDGVRTEITAKKKQLGYEQRFCVDMATERECQGLVESMLDCLANDLPVDPTNAVEAQDVFDLLDEDDAVEVGERVRKTVKELLGVFSKE